MKIIMFILMIVLFIPASAWGQWNTIQFVNEFGENTDYGAASASVGPIQKMGFPYHDMKARIFVDCDRAWIRFNKSPNLTEGDTTRGRTIWSLHWLSVRFNNSQSTRMPFGQDIGSKDLFYKEAWIDGERNFVSLLSSMNTVAISFPWYGQGNVAFRWSLNGSTDAIKASCD